MIITNLIFKNFQNDLTRKHVSNNDWLNLLDCYSKGMCSSDNFSVKKLFFQHCPNLHGLKTILHTQDEAIFRPPMGTFNHFFSDGYVPPSLLGMAHSIINSRCGVFHHYLWTWLMMKRTPGQADDGWTSKQNTESQKSFPGSTQLQTKPFGSGDLNSHTKCLRLIQYNRFSQLII